MKHKFIKGIITFSIMLFSISCANKENKLLETKITFENEIYNFHEIPEKIEAGATFNFSNIGDHPLQISDVKTSCGCTVPEWTKDKIAPNEKGAIKVIYDAKYPGRFNKTITVFYNGIDSPKKLIIKGQVM